MTEAAEGLKAAMGASMDRNRHQVAMTDESRQLLTSMLRDEMRVAVADGIAAAMTDKNAAQFCRAVLGEAQKMATEKTGEVVGSALGALVKKGLMFLFLGSIVYAIGGWSALAKLGSFFAGSR